MAKENKIISEEMQETLNDMLASAHHEMGELSKKKPDGILNEFKVKMINRLLTDIKATLQNEPSLFYLDLLDEETLPQNSDVVLILGQYKAALYQYRLKHKRTDRGW